jgi:hypothetical protein
MLVDIDGLFYIAMALADPILRDRLATEPFEDFGYETYIYLHKFVDGDDVKDALRVGRLSKVILERARYESPPRFTVSLHASLDVQKIIKTVLDFVRYLLTLKQQRALLEAKSDKDRQEVVARQIANTKELNSALNEIADPVLRSRLTEALVERTDLLLSGRDYPRLNKLNINSPT